MRFYASCWPWVPSGSALRAGALALAPTFTGLRAGGGPRLAWRPARALLHSRGGATGALAPFSLDLLRLHAESGSNVPRKAGKRAAQEAALEEIGQVRSRLRCRSAEGHTRIK